MTNKHMKTVQYCLLGKCLLKLQKDIYTPDQNKLNLGENIKHLQLSCIFIWCEILYNHIGKTLAIFYETKHIFVF